MNNNNNNNIAHFHNINNIPPQQSQTDFVLTINTNQLVEEGSDREEEVHGAFMAMLNAMTTVQDEDDGPSAWFDFTNQGVAARVASNDPTVDADHDYTEDGVDDLQRIDVYPAFERTPEGQANAGRYHAHVYFRVTHTSNIRIDYHRMLAIVERHLGLVGVRPYVWLSYAHSTFDNIVRYLRKDMINNVTRGRRGRNNNNRVPAPRNNNNYSDTEEEDSF